MKKMMYRFCLSGLFSVKYRKVSNATERIGRDLAVGQKALDAMKFKRSGLSRKP